MVCHCNHRLSTIRSDRVLERPSCHASTDSRSALVYRACKFIDLHPQSRGQWCAIAIIVSLRSDRTGFWRDRVAMPALTAGQHWYIVPASLLTYILRVEVNGVPLQSSSLYDQIGQGSGETELPCQH